MPKIIDHDKRREHIIEVTRELMVNGGFEAATMRSIAEKAGFANGALKRYFPDKKSIITATFDKVLHEIDQSARGRIDGMHGIAALREYCHAVMPYSAQSARTVRVVTTLWNACSTDPDLDAVYRRFIDDWKTTLARLYDEGVARSEIFRHADKAAFIHQIVLFNIGATMELVVISDFHVDGYDRTLVDAAVDAIATHGKPSENTRPWRH